VNALETRLLASPSLPTLPRVAQRVLELARRDDADLGELARAIGTDPALATKLLRLINSPMYHMTREVTSLRDAALYLGMNAVKNVALSFSLIHKLRGDDNSELLDALWRASLMNALAARKLATEVGGWDPEEAFLFGLIADSGVLVLLKGAESYPALLARFLAGERDLLELERVALDTDHARITWLLLEMWGFPERTRALVAAHHTELPGQLREAAAFFEIPADEQLAFPELLEQANSRLADAALASERESTELAAAASAELEARTRDLAPPLDYDSATGMVCESSFETLVEAHQQRARRRHAPLSVLVVEIAALKELASGGGAAAVNAALRELGARSVRALRPTDPSGRVGGDRIGAILPGCSTDGACAAAQRLRLALERAPIALPGQTFQVNVAIGVASLNGDAAQDERGLLSSALAALDRARETSEPISR
jgi:diguanylate cyclase (GGDEF)-like protein